MEIRRPQIRPRKDVERAESTVTGRQGSMRYCGRITEWNDDKGYGFVTPDGGGARTFVHMTALERRWPRPVVGSDISYELATGELGLKATSVRLGASDLPVTSSARRKLPRKLLAAIFLIAISIGCVAGSFPISLAFAYGFMSLVTFALYRTDKLAALQNQWRTPERTLLLVGLLGGWPGALFAQGVFNHKTEKVKFQSRFWFTVILNGAMLGGFTYGSAMTDMDHVLLKALTAGRELAGSLNDRAGSDSNVDEDFHGIRITPLNVN